MLEQHGRSAAWAASPAPGARLVTRGRYSGVDCVTCCWRLSCFRKLGGRNVNRWRSVNMSWAVPGRRMRGHVTPPATRKKARAFVRLLQTPRAEEATEDDGPGSGSAHLHTAPLRSPLHSAVSALNIQASKTSRLTENLSLNLINAYRNVLRQRKVQECGNLSRVIIKIINLYWGGWSFILQVKTSLVLNM